MKIFKFFILLFHIGLICLLLGAFLNEYIPPKTFGLINLLSLAFPFLMIVNFVLILFWAVLRKKRTLLFAAATLFMINPIRSWINFTKKTNDKPNLKIVTMNIKGAGYGREKIYDYLKNTGADVILGQEYGSEFNVPGYENRTNNASIVAINSKYKIIKSEELHTSGNGNAVYADIDIDGKIIRFVDVYLNPFSFEKKKVKPTNNMDQNETKARYILKKLVPTFKIHQNEIAAIRKAIDESPYPVILTGDFNSVPNSYEYYHLGKDLKDAFVEAGNGSATSFHDYKFPIRIDYVFCSKNFKPISYKVDRNVKLSDHFPVIATFKID